jgi:hypothetical protein
MLRRGFLPSFLVQTSFPVPDPILVMSVSVFIVILLARKSTLSVTSLSEDIQI